MGLGLATPVHELSEIQAARHVPTNSFGDGLRYTQSHHPFDRAHTSLHLTSIQSSRFEFNYAGLTLLEM